MPDELPALKATDPRINAFRKIVQATWFEHTGYSDNGPPHPAQAGLHLDEARFRCLVKGRRGGGTTSAAREIEAEAMIWEGPVGSGDIGIFAPTAELTNRVFGMIWDTLVVRRRIPREWIIKPRHLTSIPPRDKQIFFAWGARIFAYSLDAEMPGEGLGFRLVVVDEAGHKALNESTWSSSIFPTMMDRGGRALIVGASKQAGKFFRDLCRKQEHDPDWSTHRFRSEANPSVGAEEIESARRNMPDWLYRQEIEAEFVDLGDQPWEEAEIMAIVDDGLPLRRPYSPSCAYVDGWDLAKDVDWTVGVTMESSGVCQVCHGQAIIVEGGHATTCGACDKGKVPFELVAFDRFNRRPWPVVEQAMAARQAEYHSLVIFDSTGVGGVTADYLTVPTTSLWRSGSKSAKPGYIFTPRSKTELIVNLQAMIQKRMIRIPRIPQLVKELLDYRWDDESIPETDSVIALALACWALAGRSRFRVYWI